jgi:CRP/FNR family transcriptional regulator/CRP/FNR family cyclic AMP-dependent transcriptional regulator
MAEDTGQTPVYDFLTGESRTQQKIASVQEQLRHVALFSDLTQNELDLVARLANEVHAAADQALVQQGEPGNELILIANGRVRVERNGQVIAHMETGNYFGEMSLLDGYPRSATVITAVPSDLLVIQKHTFDHLLESTPELKSKLLVTLSHRLRRLQENLID